MAVFTPGLQNRTSEDVSLLPSAFVIISQSFTVASNALWPRTRGHPHDMSRPSPRLRVVGVLVPVCHTASGQCHLDAVARTYAKFHLCLDTLARGID